MNSKFKTAAIAAITSGVLAGAMFASAQTTMSTGSYCFTQNMKLGTTNSEVLTLQQTLNAKGFTVSTTGVGSMGMETNYFGAKTQAAVKKFQAANGVINTGNVFSLTRAALNVNCAGSVVNPTTPTSTPVVSGPVSVSLAMTQPNNVIVAGSARAKIADVVFSGNGTVTNVKLQRTGVSNNATLVNVYLYDAATGVRLTDAASALTDGTINFNNAYGLFTVSGARTVSVLADIASGVSGQSVGVSVVGYTTMGNPTAVVTGVNGPALPIGTADLATAYFSNTTSPSATTINAGSIGTTVWSNTVSIGTRAANLSSVTFKYVGSAPTDSLANVKLYVDGVQFANASAFSANGYVTFVGTPLSLTTGSHTVDLRADIVKGSNRNFYVSIENAGDIALQDSQLTGANVTVKQGGTSGSTISNLSAGSVTINAGSITISQDPNFTTTTAVGGSANQVLGSFKFYAYGEDVKVTRLNLTLTGTSVLPTTTALNNVTVYVNGGAVSSGVTLALGTATDFTLGSNLIVPAGSSTIVSVRGDLVNSGNSNLTAGNFQVTLNPGTNNAQGMYSSNLTGTSLSTGQTISVNTGNVAFGATSGFTASNISKNQSGVKIGSFSLQAGSSEAANVTNVAITLAGTSTAGTDYTNLRITDGSQTIVPAATNNFSVNYDVAAGQTKVVEVWVDTLEIANGKTIIASSTVTYRGRTSNTTNTVGATAPTMTAAVVSVGTPTIVGASTLGSRYVIGGNTLSNVASYNVTATNGTATLNDLTFTVTGTGIESLTIGSVTAPVVGTTVNFYGLNLSVPSGSTGLNIPVSAKYSSVLSQGGVASGVTNSFALTSMKYTAGGVVTTSSYSVAANTMTLVASLPTVKKTTGGQYLGTGATSGAKVGTVTVTADAKGDTTISNVPVTVSLPAGGTAFGFKVKANGTDLFGTTGYVAPTTLTSGFNFGTTGYRISAGTAVTFDVYADVAAVTTAGNSDVSLGTASTFSWSDIVNTTAISTTGPLTGALLQTYNN